MTAYTAGEIMPFDYVPEVTYGVTPTSALTWGCETIAIKGATDLKKQFIHLPGSRSFGATMTGMYEVGFNLKGYSRLTSGGYDWRNLWAHFAFGSTSGLSDHLDSLTGQIGVNIASNYAYDFYNGAKINKLTMSSTATEKAILFDADFFAQYMTKKTSKVLTGLQALTVGANPSAITTALVTWTTDPKINIAGGGLTTFRPDSWSLTVDNHLDRRPGNIVGNDTNKYPVCSGLDEGQRDIIFECKLPLEAETYSSAKLAGSAVTSLVLYDIDTWDITLANGEFEANDFPELKHQVNDQTLKIRFKSLTIA